MITGTESMGVVDPELIDQAKRLYGVDITREPLELGPRRLVVRDDEWRRRALAMRGSGWGLEMTDVRPGFRPVVDVADDTE